MRLILLFLFLVTSTFAQSQEHQDDMLCKLLPAYQPSDDVAYKAGVDVDGNAVVPADLNASNIDLPKVIKIPLQIDMAERLERLKAIKMKADAPLGMVEVYEDGRVIYEGKTITQLAAAACALSHRAAPEEAQKKEGAPQQTDNRQKDDNPIESEAVTENESVTVLPAEEGDLLQGGEF